MKKSILSFICISIAFFFCIFNIATNAQNEDYAFYAYYNVPITDWDPSVEFSNGIVTLNNIYETLLKYDPIKDVFINVLATDYSLSDDNLTWTFYLRKGVKFHDGTELNAEAVKFSIDRTIEINRGAAFIWEPVEQINILDDYTVEFKLKYPAPIDLICSSGYAAFIMSPMAVNSHPSDWLTKGNEAGTGPYKLERYRQEEQEVLLTWFEDYWGGWQGDHFKTALIKNIPEAVTRNLLIEKGDTDFTSQIPYENIVLLKENKNVEVFIGPSFQNIRISLNTEKEPLNDKKVRQALAYAFPYQDVVSYALEGYARQSVGPIPYGLWGHSEELFQYSYNIDKAKELLKETDVPNGGFKLLCTYTSEYEIQRKIAQLYKASLAELNIDLEIRGLPWESHWALALNEDLGKRQDLFIGNWWPDVCSPISWLQALYYSQKKPVFNLSYYKNKEYDDLIDKGSKYSGIDRNKAIEYFVNAQKILIEDVPEIFVCDRENIFISNKSFKGFRDNPGYTNVLFFYDTYREK